MNPSEESALMSELDGLVGRHVVLDTAGSVVFLGTLMKVTPTGFWLGDADLHDCSEGHATKERYIYEAKEIGIRVNRKHLFVLRQSIISLSALQDATDA
jgi:hypothetical protein